MIDRTRKMETNTEITMNRMAPLGGARFNRNCPMAIAPQGNHHVGRKDAAAIGVVGGLIEPAFRHHYQPGKAKPGDCPKHQPSPRFYEYGVKESSSERNRPQRSKGADMHDAVDQTRAVNRAPNIARSKTP